MREERIEEGQEPLPFVGSATTDAAPSRIAVAIRRALGLAGGWADLRGTWSDALRALRDRAELAGIVVVINGVVDNNTRRKLDPEEFRGFVLPDAHAPFVFVNGADGSRLPTRGNGSATPPRPNSWSPRTTSFARGARFLKPGSRSAHWREGSRSASW